MREHVGLGPDPNRSSFWKRQRKELKRPTRRCWPEGVSDAFRESSWVLRASRHGEHRHRPAALRSGHELDGAKVADATTNKWNPLETQAPAPDGAGVLHCYPAGMAAVSKSDRRRSGGDVTTQ